jgi:hypothetical protein
MAVAMANVVHVWCLSRLFYSGKSYVQDYVQTARRCAQNRPNTAYDYHRKPLIPGKAGFGFKLAPQVKHVQLSRSRIIKLNAAQRLSMGDGERGLGFLAEGRSPAEGGSHGIGRI